MSARVLANFEPMHGIGTGGTAYTPYYPIRKTCTKGGVHQNVPMPVSHLIKIRRVESKNREVA